MAVREYTAIRLLCGELKDRVNWPISVISPYSHEIRIVCEVVISRDIDLPYGDFGKDDRCFSWLGLASWERRSLSLN